MALSFIRAPSKKSLLAMLKKAKEVTPSILRKFFDGVAFKSELKDVVTASDWLQNGFPDPTEVSIAWDDATRTLTLDAVGTSFNYYIDGVLYNETDALTEQIADEEGLWVFYLDSEASISSTKNPTEAQVDAVIEGAAIFAYVYWDATNNDGRLMYEIHGSNMAPATHHWIHDNIGAVYKEGMALANFTISTGAADVDAQFSIAAGEFYDEDIEIELDAFAYTAGVEIWYLDGSAWRWSETVLTGTDFNIKVAGSGRMAFNDSGSQTEIGLNKFALCHIFATNITDDAGAGPLYISIQGQAEYATKALAREGAETEINALAYGTLPLQEIVPVATVIYQSGAYANKVKSKVLLTDSGDYYVDWRSSNIRASGGSISDHGSLAGLTDLDHPQYVPVMITVQNDTGSSMSALDLCYISGDASGTPNVILTDANAEATASKMLVVINETIADGVTGDAVTYGAITGFAGLTPAAIQYVHTTAGDFTEAAPSGTADIVRVAGYALSATVMYFNPGGSWVEVA